MATVIRPVDLKLLDQSPGFFAGPTPILEWGTGGGSAAAATPVYSLEFPDSVLSAVFFTLFVPTYGSGNVSVLLDWFAPLAIAGNATWGSQLLAQTPADAQSVYTDVLAAAVVASTAASATQAGPVRTTVAVAALDGLASNDIVQVKVYRDGTATTDTLVGPVRLRAITLSYSDT